MKVLYVINTGLLGGLQLHVLTLMRALRGVAETAVAVNAVLDDRVLPLFEREGMKVYCLNGTSGHDGCVVGRFRRVLDDFRPDVIHAHGLPLLVAVWLRFGLYGGRGRVPVFHSLHCPTGRPDWKNRLVMNLIERHVVDYWLPVSGPTWEGFRKAYPWARGEVFFNPLLLSTFSSNRAIGQPNGSSASNPLHSTFTVGMVGRNADQKDWPSFHRVEAIVKEKTKAEGESSDNLRFLNAGEESLCDGLAAIRQMDLFVMTSKHEQLPTTVLECFALGTPVCGFLPEGGTTDILRFSNGPVRAAFLAERSCERLADLVLDLMAHPAKRRALAEDGRQILENHFSAEKNCRGRLMEIYRSFAAGNAMHGSEE